MQRYVYPLSFIFHKSLFGKEGVLTSYVECISIRELKEENKYCTRRII